MAAACYRTKAQISPLASSRVQSLCSPALSVGCQLALSSGGQGLVHSAQCSARDHLLIQTHDSGISVNARTPGATSRGSGATHRLPTGFCEARRGGGSWLDLAGPPHNGSTLAALRCLPPHVNANRRALDGAAGARLNPGACGPDHHLTSPHQSAIPGGLETNLSIARYPVPRPKCEMDALVALSLAGNIVSFVQFAASIVSGAYKIHASTTGASPQVASLEALCSTLSTLASDLSPATGPGDGSSSISPAYAGQLRALASKCETDCHFLLSLLKKLRVDRPSSHGWWASLQAAIREEWNSSEVAELRRRINEYQAAITLLFSVLTRFGYLFQSPEINHQAADSDPTTAKVSTNCSTASAMWAIGSRQGNQKSCKIWISCPKVCPQ